MEYRSLYRKWRPQTFEDIIGQKHITQTLMNAISLNRISHAYIFSGPRGVGKTTTARILAKSLNCEKGSTPHPCNKCERCIRITDGYSMDVVEIDGASNNGVDSIRELRSKVNFAPAEGKYKIYIIDEVHMLSPGAFNALLKTLEEPPSHVIFIFATTDPHKIPSTILSRCQWFNFRRISLADIITKLKMIAKDEGLNINDKTLNMIARSSTGSMRDAESALDQIIAYCGKDITSQSVSEVLGIIEEEVFFEFIEAIIKNNTLKGIEIINRTSDLGGDPSQFIKNLMEYVHNLSLAKVCQKEILNLQGIFIEDKERLLKQSKIIKLEKLFNMVDYLAEAERKMRYIRHPWILLEMLVIKFTAAESYSLKEVKEEKDEYFLDFSTKEDVSISGKKNTGTREEVPPKKKVQDKIKSNAGSSTKAKESPINLELTQAWPMILDRIKKTKMAVYSFIIANNLLTIENDKLIIGFNKEYTFHKESLEKQNNKMLLQDLIKEKTGRFLAIECIINDHSKEDSFLEVEQENKKKAAKTRNEENQERAEKAGEEEDNIKKRSNEISKDNILIKESLNLFEGTITEEK
ncbi:MAG: DNA polymerase III subunit gamma/tau [Actinobacteria bacterium]|nr:DNA polymerase III subunit gamma/tau [Actinomycetota bacterium]MBE3127941.1 DNA polymerase III subunit gamma/tau [Candidatus Atribacteria bacterium]